MYTPGAFSFDTESTFCVYADPAYALIPHRDPPDLGAWADPPERFQELADRWIKSCNEAWLVATGRVKTRHALQLVKA